MGRRVKKGPPFVMLRNEVLDSPEWHSLTTSEMVAYIHIKRYYNGANNGQIQLHYVSMKKIMAPGTLSKAIKGLEMKGWIVKETPGGMYRYKSLYRMTGKYDRI